MPSHFAGDVGPTFEKDLVPAKLKHLCRQHAFLIDPSPREDGMVSDGYVAHLRGCHVDAVEMVVDPLAEDNAEITASPGRERRQETSKSGVS